MPTVSNVAEQGLGWRKRIVVYVASLTLVVALYVGWYQVSYYQMWAASTIDTCWDRYYIGGNDRMRFTICALRVDNHWDQWSLVHEYNIDEIIAAANRSEDPEGFYQNYSTSLAELQKYRREVLIAEIRYYYNEMLLAAEEEVLHPYAFNSHNLNVKLDWAVGAFLTTELSVENWMTAPPELRTEALALAGLTEQEIDYAVSVLKCKEHKAFELAFPDLYEDTVPCPEAPPPQWGRAPYFL